MTTQGLERVRAEHADAILRFERENRTWFTRWISDRGDAYFGSFAAQHEALLADQAAGRGMFYLLTDENGSVLGRFNLYLDGATTADVGYRVAQRAAGRGLATAAVGELCRLAVTDHSLQLLRAATSDENVASQKVLIRNGFVAVGRAEPGGRPGIQYERTLDAG